MTKSFVAHEDCVTSVALHANYQYISTIGHDSSIKTWDLRNYACIQERTRVIVSSNISLFDLLKVHDKKYDEAIHAIAISPYQNLLATGNYFKNGSFF